MFQQRALHIHHINRVIFQVKIQTGLTHLSQFGSSNRHRQSP
nr:MAG TPA: hypothetical protein [Caudoviricetes sp.]